MMTTVCGPTRAPRGGRALSVRDAGGLAGHALVFERPARFRQDDFRREFAGPGWRAEATPVRHRVYRKAW